MTEQLVLEGLRLGVSLADGEDVFIEPFHTLVAGQTNLSGKTTTFRTLFPEAIKAGFTVLVFDTDQAERQFTGYHEVPICYQPTMDPIVLLGLLYPIDAQIFTETYEEVR